MGNRLSHPTEGGRRIHHGLRGVVAARVWCFWYSEELAAGVGAVIGRIHLRLCRNLQSLCHRQLAHAALGHGICLTSPARLDAYDFVTGLGMVLLAFCVAVPLAQNQLYVACGLVIALFLALSLLCGPAVSDLAKTPQVFRACPEHFG